MASTPFEKLWATTNMQAAQLVVDTLDEEVKNDPEITVAGLQQKAKENLVRLTAVHDEVRSRK